jgi:uncharacterized protein (TIGR00369 family)
MSISFGPPIPFVDHLGFTLEKFEGGQSELHYAPQPTHFNSFDVTHGGAVMTLLDVVMATAARSLDPDMGAITIEMKTSFMRPARVAPGQKLLAKGQVQHRTRSMVFTEGHVYGPDGELCAMATGTFKYMPRRASAPPSTD